GIFEGVLLAFMFSFLHWRGWNLVDFKIKPGWGSTFQGFLLFIAVAIGNFVTVTGMLVAVFALQTSFSQFVPFLLANSPHLKHHSIELSWIVLISSMIL